MIRFSKTYFIIALLIFVVEVLIALFIRDRIIRPYLGDVLVVILIYCFIKSFLSWPYQLTAMGVLLFSFFIEWLQSINFVEKIGLKHSTLANTIIGNSFAWLDILAYIVGIIIVLVIEKRRASNIFI
ncbi:DUF2809 domain-containing protein [Chryseotalea sanaruensis]|uniref:DUF2809 domain-containing protein n=1 Tax=Chryseotalea sanaruensis TaxID=2482724 RepID=A0A401U5A1_9BACT|nr:DUF2809 domain-containing protein [Chryseotalea sanaruensis]GCC50098.1 DUF2809 domain-containing protein [Chryseotalea sanaruensis]